MNPRLVCRFAQFLALLFVSIDAVADYPVRPIHLIVESPDLTSADIEADAREQVDGGFPGFLSKVPMPVSFCQFRHR